MKKEHKFEKNQKVLVASTFYGNANSFVGKFGVVTGYQDGWALVSISGISDPTPIPFRERELVQAN